MKSRLFLSIIYVIILIITISSSSVFGATNLLDNPDMENGIIGWTGNSCTVTSDTTVFHSGAMSILATSRTSTASGPSQIVTSKLTTGTYPYYTEVWVKLASGTDTAMITLKVDNKYFRTVAVSVNAAGWTKISGTLSNVGAYNVQLARWYIETQSTTGNLYIDDAVLQFGGAVTPSPAPTPIVSASPIITPSPTITVSPVVTATPTITISPVITLTPTISVSPVISPTPTISTSPVVSPSPIVSPTQAPGLGVTTICTWKGNKKCAYSPTYDDGLWNSIQKVEPVHLNHGIVGTLCINTADFDVNGNWPGLKAMLDKQPSAYDVGSHTVNHVHLPACTVEQIKYECETSNAVILANTGHKAESLAFPYNDCDDYSKGEVSKYYVCARQAGEYAMGAGVSPDSTDIWGLYSHVNGKAVKESTMNGWVDAAIAAGTWLLVNNHRVDGEGWHAIALSTLDAHYAYVASKASQVWVSGMAPVGKYMWERQHGTIVIQSATTTQIVVSLTDNLDNTTYNYPLTLKTWVPNSWTSATVTQGSTTVTVSVVTEGVNKYIYYDAIPDLGWITIQQ